MYLISPSIFFLPGIYGRVGGFNKLKALKAKACKRFSAPNDFQWVKVNKRSGSTEFRKYPTVANVRQQLYTIYEGDDDALPACQMKVPCPLCKILHLGI